jgi:hypothetical protein
VAVILLARRTLCSWNARSCRNKCIAWPKMCANRMPSRYRTRQGKGPVKIELAVKKRRNH